MKKGRVLLIALVSIAAFLLVYTPHYGYPFPRHIDEWHHIQEATRLQQGEYSGGLKGFRIGFHIILLLLSKIVNLVSIYQFLPALWAVFSALALFYVVYQKTDKRFSAALFAMIFFASLKSNVNIAGLWFFNPLTFSIPFIFLYVYFFTEGIEKQNKRLILISLAIMVILLPIHAISVLFALPFLLLYALFNLGYIKREWRFFSIFLLIPLLGVLFYKFMRKISWRSLAGELTYALQFRRGWGILEIDNSFFELYSLIGYILAAIGLILIFGFKKNLKRYLAYGLWPITVLVSIMIYKMTGTSFLSPYQRNLYYFAVSLPFLSAFALDYLLKLIKQPMNRTKSIIFIIIVLLTFRAYWDIPKQIDLYKVIEDKDYQALLFLSTLPEKSTVLATPRISTAVYALSRHKPVATYFFYGNRKDCERFFSAKDCQTKQEILNNYNVKYVLSESKIHCGWKLIYDQQDYIYEVD